MVNPTNEPPLLKAGQGRDEEAMRPNAVILVIIGGAMIWLFIGFSIWKAYHR